MYGLINAALKDMLITNFGDKAWEDIYASAQVGDDSFLAMRSYDDDITYRLAHAASARLEAPIDDCMEMFGRYWIAEVATKSFASLMQTTGQNTLDCLNNLNSLHDRMSTTFLDYQPPHFDLETVDAAAGRYLVHYRSDRLGLSHFVAGLLAGLATHFGDTLTILNLNINEDSEGTWSVFELQLQ